MKFVLAFMSMAALDFVWARYTRYVVSRDAMRAGGYAAGIALLAGVTTILYVNDPWLLLATGSGAFVGTVVAMKLH